jgi:hypothetical protein
MVSETLPGRPAPAESEGPKGKAPRAHARTARQARQGGGPARRTCSNRSPARSSPRPQDRRWRGSSIVGFSKPPSGWSPTLK